ncbi:pectinesterase [Ceratobasidium sp. AG-Ba]|nr:pectinesterase [Ceratobasidium sp. AG-Ba]
MPTFSTKTCIYSNEYYSQCLAGTAAPTITKSTTTIITPPTSTSAASTPSSSIPAGAITVGPGGTYSTIAAALKDTSSNVYYLYAGTYKEQILISRANVKIYGQTSNKLDYTANTVTITNNIPASQAGSNDASGTVRVSATGVSLYNLNIANTYGKPVDQSQAIALSVQAGTFGAYACKITGYQDTLLANKGTQFYGRSYISGATDFIFGQQASIWITKSTVETIASGYITASGRNSDDSNYYVIDNSTIKGTGSCYLGRPWREYARVIVQNSNIGSNIVAAGWKVWSDSDTRTGHVYYGEYANTGSGAWRSGRVSFATKMTSGVSIATVLGSTSWIDSAYM